MNDKTNFPACGSDGDARFIHPQAGFYFQRMKVLTVDAYKFIAKCLLIDAPHLRCEADLFGTVEDPKSLIKSLHRKINDALDIFQAIVCDPSGTYRKLDGTHSDLISAIHENHEEKKDEQDKINIVHTLCVFADELRTEEDDDDLRRLLVKTRYYTKRINDIRRVINDQLMILAFCEEISPSKIAYSIAKVLNNIGVTVNGFSGDAAKDIDDIAMKSGQAAAKTKKQFETASNNGRASARSKKEEAPADHVKEAIITEVNKLKRERDKNYPDRNNGGEKGPSDNQIYQIVANKHIGANGKPIYMPTQIKEWFKPSKVFRRRGHKRK